MATATKKPAKKTSQKATGTEMQSWDEALAKRAEAAKAMAQSVGGGGKAIKTAGGRFSIDGSPAGSVLNVVLLDSILEHAWYGEDGAYDPENPKTPECFALGTNEKKLAPHEDSPNPQAATCAECPWNKFGSAERGKGKANKNIVRMLVLSEDDLEDIADGEARILKVPVTSVKNWRGYVNGITDVKKSDPIKVLTEITLVPHPKWQFEMKFRQIGEVDGELIGELIDKSNSMQADLWQPYKPFEADEAAPVGKGAGKALAKGKGGARQAPAKAARGRGR
jgi:hypothetical protein